MGEDTMIWVLTEQVWVQLFKGKRSISSGTVLLFLVFTIFLGFVQVNVSLHCSMDSD